MLVQVHCTHPKVSAESWVALKTILTTYYNFVWTQISYEMKDNYNISSAPTFRFTSEVVTPVVSEPLADDLNQAMTHTSLRYKGTT